MNEPCISCELGTATEVVLDREATINGRALQLFGDRFMHCDTCSDDYYTDDQARDTPSMSGGDFYAVRKWGLSPVADTSRPQPALAFDAVHRTAPADIGPVQPRQRH